MMFGMPRQFILLLLIISLYLPTTSCSSNDSEPNKNSDLSSSKSETSDMVLSDKSPVDIKEALNNVRSTTKDISQKHLDKKTISSKNDLQGVENFILKARQAEKTNPGLAELYYRGGISRL